MTSHLQGLGQVCVDPDVPIWKGQFLPYLLPRSKVLESTKDGTIAVLGCVGKGKTLMCALVSQLLTPGHL